MVLALLLASTLTAARPCAPIRVDVGQRLSDAKTLAELDAAAKSITKKEVALRALYRTRRLQLNPTAEEERRYFRALPRSDDEFWCIYALTYYPGAFTNVELVYEAVYGIFDRAPRIARKLGIGHDRVLDLIHWSDGEVAEHGWDAFDWLLENDPDLTAEALKRYPPKELRACNGPLTPEMSTAEVVKRCFARY